MVLFYILVAVSVFSFCPSLPEPVPESRVRQSKINFPHAPKIESCLRILETFASARARLLSRNKANEIYGGKKKDFVLLYYT